MKRPWLTGLEGCLEEARNQLYSLGTMPFMSSAASGGTGVACGLPFLVLDQSIRLRFAETESGSFFQGALFDLTWVLREQEEPTREVVATEEANYCKTLGQMIGSRTSCGEWKFRPYLSESSSIWGRDLVYILQNNERTCVMRLDRF